MKFTLFYDGDLPPNGSAKVKWGIRMQLEPQMRRLLDLAPLSDLRDTYDGGKEANEVRVTRGNYQFVPIITSYLKLRAELDVLLLSASLPGGLLHGGDIDNRLKTLLDALSVPQQVQQIPDPPLSEQPNPIFCLLEDDKLVVRLNIHNDCLLTEPTGSTRAIAVINVRTRIVGATWGNLGLQ